MNPSCKSVTLAFIYSGDYSERVIRNLINDPSFCKSCGLYCDFCKYGVYSHVHNVQAAIELQHPSKLPALVEEPEKYLPQKIPQTDLCITSGLHKDLLLELPYQIEQAGVRGLIVPIEDFSEVPSGLRKQLERTCEDLGLESAFPKPFCSLQTSEEHPTISKFINELKVGRPLLEISTAKNDEREVIVSAFVKRSAPCGSTWYVARKLIGVDVGKETLYDSIARAHHSYPCTATMNMDPELGEPILHVGGYIVREEVERALAQN